MNHIQIFDPNTRRMIPIVADTNLIELRATMDDWAAEGGDPAQLPDRMAALAQVITSGITELRRERIRPTNEVPTQE
jgi:hypothetical protein